MRREAGVPVEHPQFFWQFVNNSRSATTGFEKVFRLVVPASTHQSPVDGAAFPAALFLPSSWSQQPQTPQARDPP